MPRTPLHSLTLDDMSRIYGQLLQVGRGEMVTHNCDLSQICYLIWRRYVSVTSYNGKLKLRLTRAGTYAITRIADTLTLAGWNLPE